MLCRYSSKVSMVKKVNRKEPGVPKSEYTKKIDRQGKRDDS